ncbi:hypothetical protein G6F65_017830 [Rhizopus arrhizus]|nr:hypothetical protein G6F65_017830 [Rhizopus arrhizus]
MALASSSTRFLRASKRVTEMAKGGDVRLVGFVGRPALRAAQAKAELDDAQEDQDADEKQVGFVEIPEHGASPRGQASVCGLRCRFPTKTPHGAELENPQTRPYRPGCQPDWIGHHDLGRTEHRGRSASTTGLRAVARRQSGRRGRDVSGAAQARNPRPDRNLHRHLAGAQQAPPGHRAGQQSSRPGA